MNYLRWRTIVSSAYTYFVALDAPTLVQKHSGWDAEWASQHIARIVRDTNKLAQAAIIDRAVSKHPPVSAETEQVAKRISTLHPDFLNILEGINV
jgi:hypothetical protein